VKSDIRKWSNAKGDGHLFSIDLVDSVGKKREMWREENRGEIRERRERREEKDEREGKREREDKRREEK
jgi:hypothetical protein